MTAPGREHRAHALPSLPVLEQPETDRLGADQPRTVLITGASGGIGRKLRAAWADRYDLILLDSRPDVDDAVIEADLSVWDEEWVALFDEADVVVHLAANPNPEAEWSDLVGPNLDGLNHVFLATLLAGIDRLVFASSNHAMGGYENAGVPVDPSLPPRPDGPYGASKLVGERLGIALSRTQGLTFVGLRIGWAQHGENRAETLPHSWAREMWLSNDDLVALFTRAIEAELEPGSHLVVNGVSANRGGLWPLDEARSRLGYLPRDDACNASDP
jgi:nucleoside-diphosphate-sugar epimerase